MGGELKRKGIEGLATFDYFFPKGFDFWEITANGLYHFTEGSTVKPYVGAGVIFGRVSAGTAGFDDSDFGLNLIGGRRFKGTGAAAAVRRRADRGQGWHPVRPDGRGVLRQAVGPAPKVSRPPRR